VPVNGHVIDPQKQQNTDELVQLALGVMLIAFAVIGLAFLLAARVQDVLAR
jgi:hypothetical protein